MDTIDIIQLVLEILVVPVVLGLGGFAWKKVIKPVDRKSTRLNSSHSQQSRMPSSA